MSDDHIAGSDDELLLAAEYVLGVLNAAERHEFEKRMARRPTLVAEVEYWERRLGGLASEVKPIPPPQRVWASVETALKGSNGSEVSPAFRSSLWNSLAFWRWATIGSTAAAASVVALVLLGRAPDPGAPLVAKLDNDGGRVEFVAAINPARNGLTVVPASFINVDQRALELWLIAPGDKPRSLGLIETGRPIYINLPADLVARVAAEVTLAVSLEPSGGSPTGLPTGPVVATGKLTNL